MKLEHNDKVLIFFIKYAPILFVIALSLFTTQIVLIQKNQNLKDELLKTKENYYNTNKERSKEEINKILTYIKKEKSNTNKLLKEYIKQRVYEAHNIATKIYDTEIKRHSKEETLEIIKNTLRSIIFNNNRGYFFILDEKGINHLQPLNPQFEGKSFANYKDKNGYIFINTVKQTIKNKTERYDSYFWYKEKNTVTTYEKISFYKYFEPLNMVIGTGEYVKDFENELKEKVLKEINEIRYANDRYIFIIDYKGKYLTHYNKELIGKNKLDEKNQIGKYITKDLINFGKNNGGYISYLDTLNIDKFKKDNIKISFIKSFDDWNWIIGTGFYTENLNKTIKEQRKLLEKVKDESVKDIVFISIFITLILLIISFFISKLLEKRLLSYKKKIEKKIDENREKDNIMFQQSKMAIMGEMIANIAHQWRQPLSQISTISSGVKMQEELGILKKDEIRTNMDNINNSVQYLSQTIDDFRNFFSPSKNYTTFRIERTVEKTLNLVKSQLDSSEIQIIKDINNYEIYSLENEISQVLINLLKNAKEALLQNNKNRIKLILIKTFNDDKNIYLTVQDNAGGIPKEIVSNIFKPYFTTKGKEGTGIGLFMSKNILERNIFGTLNVENCEFLFEDEPYKGARFTIVIPIENHKD